MSVYFLRHGNLIKIGYSADVEVRVTTLIKRLKTEATYLGYMPGDRKVEGHFHRMFQRDRHHGEWFDETPRLLALISEVAIPEYPGSEVDSTAARLISLDQKFAEEAAEGIEAAILELDARDLDQQKVAAMLAPALGIPVHRFIEIRDCEAVSVTVAEYETIVRAPEMAKGTRRPIEQPPGDQRTPLGDDDDGNSD